MSNGPPETADVWRARLRSVLDEHYVVGVQEHFAEAVKLFAGEFGWQRLIAPQVRVNTARPRELGDEETRELILAYNWLDAELHGEYARRIEESITAATNVSRFARARRAKSRQNGLGWMSLANPPPRSERGAKVVRGRRRQGWRERWVRRPRCKV